MKNINPKSDNLERHQNPLLISSGDDFSRLPGEDRLRRLAKTIPSHGYHQLISTTQSCISATIHSTQEYLSQIVSSLSLVDPILSRLLTVSSSGLDAKSWLERTKSEGSEWICDLPVSGHITCGRLDMPPVFGMSAFEPAITLQVSRGGDDTADSGDFTLYFSVCSDEDMKLLASFINDTGDTWDEFEAQFGITSFTSIPLPDSVEKSLPKELRCRDYINAFVDHVVADADEDECLETIELQFEIDEDAPLHQPIVAAIALLNAFYIYEYAIRNPDKHDHIALSIDKLRSAYMLQFANRKMEEV